MTYITTPCTPATTRRPLLTTLVSRLSVLRQRRALKGLDARALEDIGVSRAAANAEAKRPIWDAPETWHY